MLNAAAPATRPLRCWRPVLVLHLALKKLPPASRVKRSPVPPVPMPAGHAAQQAEAPQTVN
jgi:hypothetical protein